MIDGSVTCLGWTEHNLFRKEDMGARRGGRFGGGMRQQWFGLCLFL